MNPDDFQKINEILTNFSEKVIYSKDIGGNSLLQKVFLKIEEKKNTFLHHPKHQSFGFSTQNT